MFHAKLFVIIFSFHIVTQNGLVQFIVFGNGQDSLQSYSRMDGSDSKLPVSRISTESTSKEGRQYYFRLAFCTIGLQASYLVWGLLQEKIMTQEYEPDSSSFEQMSDVSNDLIRIYQYGE